MHGPRRCYAEATYGNQSGTSADGTRVLIATVYCEEHKKPGMQRQPRKKASK